MYPKNIYQALFLQNNLKCDQIFIEIWQILFVLHPSLIMKFIVRTIENL